MSELDTEDEEVYSFAPVSQPLTAADIEDAVGEDGIIPELMDIRQPLHYLKSLLEQKLGADLSDYGFWLQDSQLLEPHMNLVDQCVQGEGLVQINVELKSESGIKKINIVDVLKPDVKLSDEESEGGKSDEEETVEEEQLEIGHEQIIVKHDQLEARHEQIEVRHEQLELRADHLESQQGDSLQDQQKKETLNKWVVCSAFRKEQEAMKIPTDPAQWSVNHVQHWLRWAAETFQKTSINLKLWDTINGVKLCNLSHLEFKERVYTDPGDLFWTHLELLRKCKFVAVVQPTLGQSEQRKYSIGPNGVKKKKPVTLGVARLQSAAPIPDGSPGNRSGNNGQTQLWQFLLELLTDRDQRNVIHWQGDEGEFKLSNPEFVAQLWGVRKNKPSMNYEKLSRALRYYYDGDMICKVHGKRFVYKFVCDLKQLVGYSAQELNKLVIQAEQRAKHKKSWK